MVIGMDKTLGEFGTGLEIDQGLGSQLANDGPNMTAAGIGLN